MNCPNCGKQIASGLRFCPECGFQLTGTNTPPVGGSGGIRGGSSSDLVYPRNPPLSPHLAWLSLFIPGLAQLIFGQVVKGIVIAVAFYASIPTAIGPLIILVAAIIDAYMLGTALQNGKPVGKWQFFPS